MPEASSGADLTQVATLIGIGCDAAFAWWKQYSEGHKAEERVPVARQVILERAEMADLSSIERLCRDLKPGLQKLCDAWQDDHDLLIENNAMGKQVIEKLDRLERRLEHIDTEMEIAKRVAERLADDRRR